MNTKHEFWARKKELNKDFIVSGTPSTPATIELVEAYEQSSGYILSDDVRDFLTTFGSLQFEVKDEVWKHPQVGDVTPAWQLRHSFFIYGLCPSDDMPEWMGYEAKNKETLEHNPTPHGQLFFKRNGNGKRAYTHKGVITVEHGLPAGEFEIFEGNIYDFLIEQINELEALYLEHFKAS